MSAKTQIYRNLCRDIQVVLIVLLFGRDLAESKLANYLLPRDCPRVCFSAGKDTLAADRHRFLGSSKQVIAIESCWYERAIATMLYLDDMPSKNFALFDAIAEYYVTDSVVVPTQKHLIKTPIIEIIRQDVELRILPSLWQLHDEVARSSLDFSIVRIKNARSRITA